MDILAENISNWNWLFSVVIVGIGINIIAHYLKIYLDKVLTRVSVWYNTRTETKRLERLDRIEELAQDQHGQILQGLATNRIQNSFNKYLILTALFLLLSVITYLKFSDISVDFAVLCMNIPLLLSGICAIISLKESADYFYEVDILREAQENSIKQSGATSDSTQEEAPEVLES